MDNLGQFHLFRWIWFKKLMEVNQTLPKLCCTIIKEIKLWKSAQHHQSSGKYKSKSQWDITLHLLEWLPSKIQGEDVEKREFLCTVDAITMENSLEFLQKTKKRTTIWSSSPISGYLSKRRWKQDIKEISASSCLLLHFHNSQDLETT